MFAAAAGKTAGLTGKKVAVPVKRQGLPDQLLLLLLLLVLLLLLLLLLPLPLLLPCAPAAPAAPRTLLPPTMT